MAGYEFAYCMVYVDLVLLFLNLSGLTLEMFKNKTSFGSEMIDLLELRNKCVIEVRGNSARCVILQFVLK